MSNAGGAHGAPAPGWGWRLVGVAALAGGCIGTDQKPTGPPTGGQIAGMAILMADHPMNWDDDPEYDGLSLNLYFASAGRRGEMIAVDGTLTFRLYLGQPTTDAKPFYEWRFTSAQLKEHLGRSTIGWGYSFRLSWGDKVPTTPEVTLVSELQTAGGEVHRSRAAVVRMGSSQRR